MEQKSGGTAEPCGGENGRRCAPLLMWVSGLYADLAPPLYCTGLPLPCAPRAKPVQNLCKTCARSVQDPCKTCARAELVQVVQAVQAIFGRQQTAGRTGSVTWEILGAAAGIGQ